MSSFEFFQPRKFNVFFEVLKVNPEVIPYVSRGDEYDEAFEEYFYDADLDRQVQIVLSLVLRGMTLPSFILEGDTLPLIRYALRSVYLSPIRFVVNLRGREVKVMMSMPQFQSLRQIYACSPVDMTAPMILSPPEYWYLYALCSTNAPDLNTDHYEYDPFGLYGPDVPHFTCMGADLSFNKALSTPSAESYERLFGSEEPFTSGEHSGASNHLSFLSNMPSLSLAPQLVECWPVYWLTIDSLSSRSKVAKHVTTLLPLIVDSKFQEMRPLPSSVPVHRGFSAIARRRRVRDFGHDKFQPDVVEVISSTNVQEDVEEVCPVPSPCIEEPCCVNSLEADYVENVGLSAWPTVFVDNNIHVPVASNGVKIDDVLQRQSFTTSFPCVELDFVDHEVTDPPDVEVLVPGLVWDDYLNIDQTIARYATASLYEQRVSAKPTVPFKRELLSYLNKQPGDTSKLPSTFEKWAYMFAHWGYVPLVAGFYPLAQCGKAGVSVLEIGAPPYGAMVAAIEGGLCDAYHYTRYKREFSKDPPYESRVSDFLVEIGLNKSDLQSIARRLNYLRLQQHLSSDTLDDTKELTKHSLIIVDVPLHTNSASGIGGKCLRRVMKNRDLEESVDDLPLGKSESLQKMLGDVLVLVDCVLMEGGDLILKLQECWDSASVYSLWKLTRSFGKVDFLRNPFSKDSSKDIYVRFSCKYGGRLFSDLNAAKLNFRKFSLFMAAVNAQQISLLNLNLISLARRYGYQTKSRKNISCRKKLKDMKCERFFVLDLVNVDNYYAHPFNIPTVTLPFKGGKEVDPGLFYRESTDNCNGSGYALDKVSIDPKADALRQFLKEVGIKVDISVAMALYKRWGNNLFKYLLQSPVKEHQKNLIRFAISMESNKRTNSDWCHVLDIHH